MPRKTSQRKRSPSTRSRERIDYIEQFGDEHINGYWLVTKPREFIKAFRQRLRGNAASCWDSRDLNTIGKWDQSFAKNLGVSPQKIRAVFYAKHPDLKLLLGMLRVMEMRPVVGVPQSMYRENQPGFWR